MIWKKILKKINLPPTKTEERLREAQKRNLPGGNPSLVQGTINFEKKEQLKGHIEEQLRNLQEEFNKKKAELESKKRDLESSQMFHN